jgi:hypothetical protein
LIVAAPSDEAVRVVIDQWLAKLCDHDFEGAIALLVPRTKWNATLLETAIRNRGVVTASASGPGPRFVVDWFGRARRDGCIGIAEIQLPINGAWSDVTSTFNVLETDDGLRLALEDVRQN